MKVHIMKVLFGTVKVWNIKKKLSKFCSMSNIFVLILLQKVPYTYNTKSSSFIDYLSLCIFFFTADCWRSQMSTPPSWLTLKWKWKTNERTALCVHRVCMWEYTRVSVCLRLLCAHIFTILIIILYVYTQYYICI